MGLQTLCKKDSFRCIPDELVLLGRAREKEQD
jgi:hypothetical protein